mmetsp:Transcript_9748/g.24067  ORF Transcript_9748/g.24067 Transcript_9748/m.24067 type:complete len:277 (-) Transcript_9748:199-1029(-)
MVPNGISESAPPPGSSRSSSNDVGTTAAFRTKGTVCAAPSTVTSTVVRITPTSGGVHVTEMRALPPSGPFTGPTSPNAGSILSAAPRVLSQSTLKAAARGPALDTVSVVATALPCATTPISSDPSTRTSAAGACALNGTSACPLSVWTRTRSKKLSSRSAANDTSKVVDMPGASLTVLDSPCTASWNFFVMGLRIFTVWMRVSALRTVTSQVYVVWGSTSVKCTSGGNTLSQGTGADIASEACARPAPPTPWPPHQPHPILQKIVPPPRQRSHPLL